jgi:4-carboxymuconolactone decarboxylase
MAKSSTRPPQAYREFIRRHPKLGEAWESIREAEDVGPLDQRTARLVKLGVAIGGLHVGAVHSAVRKALSAGASRAAIQQVVALAAGTIGFPSAVAVDGWIQTQFRGSRKRS